MFVPDKLFHGSIEHKTQAVGQILATLGKPNYGRLVVLCMCRINCHMLSIVGVVLGNCGAFVLGVGDAVVKNQNVTFVKPP
jgi:hypothetical protein